MDFLKTMSVGVCYYPEHWPKSLWKEDLERMLLSLQEDSNHVLRAELNMGLDNIILREDLTSIDILKLML